MGEKREDTRTGFAPLGDVMRVKARGIAPGRDGMKVEAEGGGFWQEQRHQVRKPSRQEVVLIFPLCAVRVVRGKGRLGEDIEPGKKPERLIKIEVADMAAAFFVQQLP